MSVALSYWSFAETQRREAVAAMLPRVRELHLSAAERWEQLAREAELFEPSRRKAMAVPEWIS
jgi:hypothetical protein